LNRIVKIIRGKRGYFIQREDADLIWDYGLKQFRYRTEHMSRKALISEIEGYWDSDVMFPINASEEVLNEIEKQLNKK
jgi:hypothetical protein